MRRYLTRANRGELEVRVRGVQDGGRALYAVGRQMIYTVIALFTGSQALESWRRHEVSMAHGFAAVAVVAGVFFVGSSLLSRPRQ
jgi:ubiquinone biosynthesis protein